jgi:hypothetical protein
VTALDQLLSRTIFLYCEVMLQNFIALVIRIANRFISYERYLFGYWCSLRFLFDFREYYPVADPTALMDSLRALKFLPTY